MEKWKMEEGLSKEEAHLEANRCLSCKNPRCETGCPTHMRIRDFIKEIKNNDLTLAANIIYSCSSMPYICSIVCPHEKQCIGHCILNAKQKPINVGALERFVVEQIPNQIAQVEKTNRKVAIIGAGPAGIACAKTLAMACVSVEIFEASNYFGGVMLTGIPNYRLDISRVERLKKELLELGVVIHYNKALLESDIIKLKDDFDFVFIGIGLPHVKKLGIPKEELFGVYDALEFLKDVNLATKLSIGTLPTFVGTTVVIGAGNVAMDAARSAIRCGSKVIVAYRRSLEEAPAIKKEIEEAMAEGVTFKFLNAPVEILGEEKVSGLKVEKMKLGDADSSGRRRPVGTNEFEVIPCNQIISAIGQNPKDIYDLNKLKTDYLYLVCEDLKTNIDRIYAGGDIVLGAKTVVEAMYTGRCVATQILKQYEKN